jgi:hypothetical protein
VILELLRMMPSSGSPGAVLRWATSVLANHRCTDQRSDHLDPSVMVASDRLSEPYAICRRELWPQPDRELVLFACCGPVTHCSNSQQN